jgi:hypothetical protein
MNAREAAGTYVQLSREEFQDWLDSKGYRGKWKIKPGTSGVYLVPLSDTVWLYINSTTGKQEQVMGRGRAAMSMMLVSRTTDKVILGAQKLMGQKHFKRTLNWRATWGKGLDRAKATYTKSQSFYDAVAEIADRDKYKIDMLHLIESVVGWDQDSFLLDMHSKVKRGGIITKGQTETIRGRESGAPMTPTPLHSVSTLNEIARLRELYAAARRSDDDWTMTFTQSLGEQLKRGRPLSPKQEKVLKDKYRRYRIQ